MHPAAVLTAPGVAIYCLVKDELIGIDVGSPSVLCRYELGVNRSCCAEAGIQ